MGQMEPCFAGLVGRTLPRRLHKTVDFDYNNGDDIKGY
jgi:hypothetical protein